MAFWEDIFYFSTGRPYSPPTPTPQPTSLLFLRIESHIVDRLLACITHLKDNGDWGRLLNGKLICSFLKLGIGELHLRWTSAVCAVFCFLWQEEASPLSDLWQCVNQSEEMSFSPRIEMWGWTGVWWWGYYQPDVNIYKCAKYPGLDHQRLGVRVLRVIEQEVW